MSKWSEIYCLDTTPQRVIWPDRIDYNARRSDDTNSVRRCYDGSVSCYGNKCHCCGSLDISSHSMVWLLCANDNERLFDVITVIC